MHLTEVGRRTLSTLSRDPYNPEGYLAAVRPLLAPGSVALSYLEEGVNTFQAGCLKATAVMVGAAAESLVLDVRDTLVIHHRDQHAGARQVERLEGEDRSGRRRGRDRSQEDTAR